jgi:hypothetical protein
MVPKLQFRVLGGLTVWNQFDINDFGQISLENINITAE